jgi:hypothetical protein
MEETRISETSVGFQRTTRRYIPEDITLFNRRLFWESYETHKYILGQNPEFFYVKAGGTYTTVDKGVGILIL